MFSTIAALIIAACLTIFSSGCGGPGATSYYQNEQQLMEIRSMRYQMDYNQDSNLFVFDEHEFTLKVSIFGDRAYHFEINLENPTDQPMVIFWNGIEYLDLRGRPHSVIHDGINYLDPVSKQRPTVVAPGSAYHDLLRPADRQEVDGQMRLVRIKRPTGSADWGDQVILVIPMKVLGQARRYHFTLDVGDFLANWPGDPDPFWY